MHDFFERVTPEDRRFRFLGSVKEVGHAQLASMTDVDHHRTESFVASEPATGRIAATAMLACDDALEAGEVAISVRGDLRDRGLGWALLEHVTEYARKRGIKRLQSVEDRANRSAIGLEQEAGFTSKSDPDDSTLVILQKVLSDR
jgi:GNAT superfamily N-acetyltransferase